MADEASNAGSNMTEVAIPTFALSPALATDDVIDYTSKSGETLWREATAKLCEEAFDCDANNMRDFLELLRTRSETMGWDNSVLAIPTDPDHPEREVMDFFKHYGKLSMEDLRKAGTKAYIGTQTRYAQDSMQLYKCLHNSLSKIGRDKVTLHREAYSIGGQPVGVLLLKTIIQQSHIDTNATTSAIRYALATLDSSYMPVVSYDITKFNQYVRTQLEALQARGETTHDLTTNLFRAYLTVKDRDFKEYIKRKESDYEENNERLEPEKLMNLAENRFKIRKLRGIWNAPSLEDEKIIALEAKLKQMEVKQTGRGSTNSGETNTNYQKKKRRVDEEWMMVKPKPGEPHDKEVDGKDWHWCPTHEKWTRHTASQCQGKGTSKSKDQAKPKPQERKVRFANALSALVEDSDSNEE